MRDPDRYTEDGGDEALRAGLLALRREGPSAEARDRTLALLLGTAAGATTVTAAGTATGATAVAKAAVPAKATALIFAKWAGIGVFAGAVALGGYELAARPPAETRSAVPASGVAASRPMDPTAPDHETPSAAIPSSEPAPPPVVVPPGPLPRVVSPASTTAAATTLAITVTTPTPPAPLSTAPTAPSAPTVADEVQKLEVVRAAIRARRGDDARTAITAYRAAFPRGILGSEAFVLEIEAAAIDDAAAARRLAESFLQRNPQSPLAARVRRAGGLPEPSTP